MNRFRAAARSFLGRDQTGPAHVTTPIEARVGALEEEVRTLRRELGAAIAYLERARDTD